MYNNNKKPILHRLFISQHLVDMICAIQHLLEIVKTLRKFISFIKGIKGSVLQSTSFVPADEDLVHNNVLGYHNTHLLRQFNQTCNFTHSASSA